MRYDCFMFNDELDLLRLRLNVLRGQVDLFVLVEAPLTHSGQAEAATLRRTRGGVCRVPDSTRRCRPERRC